MVYSIQVASSHWSYFRIPLIINKLLWQKLTFDIMKQIKHVKREKVKYDETNIDDTEFFFLSKKQQLVKVREH